MKCSVCEKNFEEKDDVVVCPECGTPYHRECYIKNGACVFEKEHANGFEYAPPKTEKEGARCANCGADNKSINLFCEHCGSPLRNQDDETHKFNGVNAGGVQNNGNQSGNFNNGQSPNGGAQNGGANGQNSPINFSFGSGQIATPFGVYMQGAGGDKEIDGIKASEWAKFIGNSAPYYLYQFQRMDAPTNKFKITFCWSALFFSTFYFAYRKMYSWALLSALGAFIVNIPSTLSMLSTFGVGFAADVSSAALTNLAFICSILSWGLSAFFCFFSFYLYRQHAARKIKKSKEKNLSESDYFHELEKTGGTSFISIAVVVAIIFAASYLFTLWIGPDNIYAMYSSYFSMM